MYDFFRPICANLKIFCIFAGRFLTWERPKIMAKGSAMGLWRGKKGSTVFYYNRNSNNSQKQAMRERVYEISNPRTSAQAGQRMKLAPAQRVANALNAIIKRSWQGVEYGGKGRQEFMKRALSMTSGWPFVSADDDRAVPGEYQISKGSIPEIVMASEETTVIVVPTIPYVSSSNDTIGIISGVFINAGYRAGDQITIAVCTSDANNVDEALTANYYWHYGSFILDTSNTQILREWSEANIQGVELASANYGTAPDEYIAIINSTASSVAAAAIIVSRLNGATYERSTARLALSPIVQPWFAAGQKAIARRSYEKKDAAASVNWPVDPDEGETSTLIDALYTITGATGDFAPANGQQVRVMVDENNVPKAVYMAQFLGEYTALAKQNGQPLTVTVSMQETPVGPEQVPALNGLRQIPLT